MYKLIKYYPTFLLAASILPLAAKAQTVQDIFDDISSLLNFVIATLFIIALVIFLWGVVKFIMVADDEKQRTAARGIMTWGIVGMAIMASTWGIITAIVNFFELDIPVPLIRFPESPGIVP